MILKKGYSIYTLLYIIYRDFHRIASVHPRSTFGADAEQIRGKSIKRDFSLQENKNQRRRIFTRERKYPQREKYYSHDIKQTK